MKPVFTGVLMVGLAALGFGAMVAFHQDENVPAEIAAATLPQATTTQKVKKNAGDQSPATSTAVKEKSTIAQLPEGLTPFGNNIGGTFDLIDHFGEARQLEDYRGKHVMVFFGYANCLAICSAALPLMADTIDLLGDDGKSQIVPLMITVDPKNDTPDFMRKKLAEYHPMLIGMTGSEGALADVRSKFQIKIEYVGEDIEGNPIYNHGSFIYLLGPDGKFETLVPPILGPPQMAKIIKKYLAKTEG